MQQAAEGATPPAPASSSTPSRLCQAREGARRRHTLAITAAHLKAVTLHSD